MKKRLYPVVSTLALSTALAASLAWAGNPLIQTCQRAGGIFRVLAPGLVEDLPVCVFGSAVIGAHELQNHKSGCSNEAVDTFLSSGASSSGTPCEDNNAEELSKGLCKFSDGSLIGKSTLAQGAETPANASLIRALNAPSDGVTDPNQTCDE